MNASRLLKTLSLILLTLALSAAGFALQPQKEAASASALAATTTPDVYPVVKVIDGDTIDVLKEGVVTRLRIIGMDTPELHDPRKPVQCFARAAADEAHRMLDGQYVRLEYQPDDIIDKYGRTLAYVFLLDGTNYEDYMIRSGYAHEYTYQKPYLYQDQFNEAEAEARDQKRGFWAEDTCAGNTTKPEGAQ